MTTPLFSLEAFVGTSLRRGSDPAKLRSGNVSPRVSPFRATNINLNLVLASTCMEDAAKFCNDSALYPEPGAVITCLRCALAQDQAGGTLRKPHIGLQELKAATIRRSPLKYDRIFVYAIFPR
eukprot:5038884-Pyramimonas_sp.AAC.1